MIDGMPPKMNHAAHLSPEDQTILLLARGELTPHIQERALAFLATMLRWELILERAREHQVYPLLFRNLDRLGFPGMSGQVRADLEALCKINAFHNTLLAEELARVLTLLTQAGIPAIPLKGVTLAESLYGDVSLRLCTDIDVLVPHQMVAQAFHLLLASGYRAEFTERFFVDRLLHRNTEGSLTREERGFCYVLDLHWGVLYGIPLDGGVSEDLWGETRPKAFFGVPAYTLSPEWNLLFLAAHAAHHQWQGLKWLVDIHEVCIQGKIDWEKLRAKARRLGWQDVLRLSLSVCRTLFSTPIPGEFPFRRLPPRLALFPANPSVQRWEVAFFPLHLLKRPSDKLRYGVRLLFLPTLAEHRLLQLPSALGFLYYPLRILRLVYRWTWRGVYASFRRLSVLLLQRRLGCKR
jgi:Uncharacterised nucleotidyltransferase